MLNIDSWINYQGVSTLDNGTAVMIFHGQINNNNPSQISISEQQSFEDSYKNNVDTIRQDRKEFEDYVYSKADDLLQQFNTKIFSGSEVFFNKDISEWQNYLKESADNEGTI